MRERDRLSVKQHREAIEAQERAEREASERPIREAESKLQQTQRELVKVYRARLLGQVIDPDRISIDPSVQGVRMAEKQASEFNATEFRKFTAQNPELYFPHELLHNIGEYFDRNGLRIITASMLAALIDRYRDAGLLPERPAPEPEPEPESSIEPEPTVSDVEVGVDWMTGRELILTRKQVELLSADDYRRFKRLTKAAIALPNVGPGPRGRSPLQLPNR